MTETTDQAANADEKFRYSLHQVLETLIQNPKQVLLLDGGTGEELFRRNVPDDRKIWSATALVHPEYHHILEEVHSSFLHSGCSFISTNSYGVVPGVGFDEEEIATYMNQAGLIARQAATNFLSGKKQDEPTVQKIQHPVFVLGSLGPLIESYRPDLILTHEEGSKCYQRACVALAPHVDAYLGETLSSVAESLQVLDAGVRLKPDDRRPLLVSYTLDSNGNLRDGQDATRAIRQLIDQWKSKYSDIEIIAIMFNCCSPEAITTALERIHADKDLSSLLKDSKMLLGAYANCLTEIDPNWSLQESQSPQSFRKDLGEEQYWEEFVSKWTGVLGVQLVGGCCGIRPSHIEYIRKQLDKSC